MKKLLILFFAVFAMSAYAQTGLGVRAGLNLANQTFSADGFDISPDAKIGFQLGVVYGVAINETISFRPGLLYSTKGSSIKQEFLGEEIETTSSFNYLEIPLDFVYQTGKILINAGPYIGYALSGSVSDGEESEDIDWEDDDTKRTDFGLNFGLGYHITPEFSLNLNYGLGLSNLVDGESSEDFTSKNTNIALFGIYSF